MKNKYFFFLFLSALPQGVVEFHPQNPQAQQPGQQLLSYQVKFIIELIFQDTDFLL